MKLIRGFIILIVLIGESVYGQVNRYAIYFKDKSNSPYDINRPAEFLSARSIQRRVARKATLTKNDLPVNPSYVQSIRDAGLKILYRSKWLNAVIVEAQPDQLSAVSNLPMVATTTYLGPGGVPVSSDNEMNKDYSAYRNEISSRQSDLAAQLTMVEIDVMHADGFQGEGILIAVTDSGFPGINSVNEFSSIFSQVKDSYNFVFRQNDVYGFDAHGTTVLSVIGGNMGTLKGSAPKAGFLLYVTEHVPTEYRIEEFNWVLAAERADSVGADVINTSLGYFNFDDASMNYRYADMDGKSTTISQGAQIASETGMLVVASAGNEGNGSWQYLTAPSDSKDVLSVGAVDNSLSRASFSSKGPASDGRIKPDVVALGVSAKLLLPSGVVSEGSGTSYSASIISGLAAGVLQAYPDLSVKEILAKIRESGSLYDKPDALMGYGIPSYVKLRSGTITAIEGHEGLILYPNPVTNGVLRIKYFSSNDYSESPVLFNSLGQLITPRWERDEESGDYLIHLKENPAGVYLLKANGKVSRFVIK